MAFNKNQVLELSVLDINHLGFGVAKPDGFVVFVQGGVPGDLVEAIIIKATASYAVARIRRVLRPSEHRAAEGRCPIGGCTACAYKSVSYEFETACKHASVVHALRKAGLSGVPVAPLLSTGAVTHYRNKAQYPVARAKDGGLSIGFFAPKSHRVCEAAACPLQPPVFEQILETVRRFAEAHGIEPYDEKTHTGTLRHIYLRRGERTGQILLTLVAASDALPAEGELVRAVSGLDVGDLVAVAVILNSVTVVLVGEGVIHLLDGCC